jgi:hypothetical protein
VVLIKKALPPGGAFAFGRYLSPCNTLMMEAKDAYA